MYTEESTPSNGRSDLIRTDEACRRLLRNVEITQDEEIDCTVCLERVPIYIDRLLADADVATEMPEMHLHLALCGDCFEEYEALRDIVKLGLAGDLPDRVSLLEQLDRRYLV
ncbi:MAG: hypothetical protein ACRDIE_13715 [Chloroflexota bacterium]